jgi:iron complex outermembrane receptor protein
MCGRLLAPVIAGLYLCAPPMVSAEGAAGAQSTVVQTVTVVAGTPTPGVGVAIDKLPNAIQTLVASSLSEEGTPSVTTALSAKLSNVSINDDLDDPFQPDILFRGFEASPVLGTPEGLAVYENGVRVNEAFGDALNWDLFPDVAVNRVTVVSSNPVYGLNALGGAVVIEMKNGFTYHGGELEVTGGSWGQRGILGQYGMSSGPFGVYVAGRIMNEDGWRRMSPDGLRQLYTALSYRTDRLTLDLNLTGADNRLSGESPSPVQELAVDRSFIFTSPQANRNLLAFVTLGGSYIFSNDFSVQGGVYYRNYKQSVVNGNTTHFTACGDPYEGQLCQRDGTTPLTDTSGAPIPDISRGGNVYIGENDYESIHSATIGGSVQATESGALFGHENYLSVGGSIDRANTAFSSSVQVGTINPMLVVASSNLFVSTSENTPFTATPVRLIATNRYYGVFGTDTFNLTHALAVTASARYNIAKIGLSDQRGTALSGKNRYDRVNPAIGFSYRLTTNLTAFAGYSEGARTPTPGEIECSNPDAPCLLPSSLSSDPPILRQVVSRTWEAGLRGHFQTPAAPGQFVWSADLFRTDVDDDIYGVATSLSAGYFQNIGGTRRKGAELSLNYTDRHLSVYVSYSYIQATFQASFLLHSEQNPYADENGNIQVRPGDVLPGIPAHRIKLGGDFQISSAWLFGGDLLYESSQYFRGDESNQMKPLAAYAVLNLHSRYKLGAHIELFVDLVNALNSRYATFGVLGDPTGVGAPGIPDGAATDGPGVDNRFESPAPPISVFGGVRIRF